MLRNKFILIQVLLLLLIVGCNSPSVAQNPSPLPAATFPPTISRVVPPASIQGPIELVGEPEVILIESRPERVRNCGNSNTIIKNPSFTIITKHTVEWEVGGSSGTGLMIGEGVIPGGLNLNTALDGRVIKGIEQEVQKTVAWDLPAGSNEHMEYTLLWREVWQTGYLNVLPFDQKLLRVKVHYLTDIQSEIISNRNLGCPSSTSASPTIIPTSTLEPPTMTPTNTPEAPTMMPTGTVSSSDDTKNVRCQEIQSTFPQTRDAITSSPLFQFPVGSSIDVVREECGGTATGFVYNGPPHILSVPEGGCIDSDYGAFFSEQPVDGKTFTGQRAYSGTVKATTMTYRVAWCELKP